MALIIVSVALFIIIDIVLQEKLNSVIEENNEKAYGYVSLFKTWQLTIRTICVTIAFTASAFVYYQLTLNIGNLGGKKLLIRGLLKMFHFFCKQNYIINVQLNHWG